jgi:Protein of unknown function (DUF2795)
MDLQEAARVQAVLEGIPLPASKDALVSYARDNDGSVASLLGSLPEREYESLDDVGEALVPVQPLALEQVSKQPHAESGSPPGADAYTDPDPETGRVREGTE